MVRRGTWKFSSSCKNYFVRQYSHGNFVEQREKFHNGTQCHVCEKLLASDDTRVHDHCHLNMQYRGPVHSNYKDSQCIPVVFHNLSGYDAYFIIKEIAMAT